MSENYLPPQIAPPRPVPTVSGTELLLQPSSKTVRTIKERPRIPGSGSSLPRPFVKAVGGKRSLLPELLKRVPESFGRYHEPFVGGGALFWALARAGRLPRGAVLSDKNALLILTWEGVRSALDETVRKLLAHAERHNVGGKRARDYYLAMRAQRVEEWMFVSSIAAWFIYVNRAGFNGLYRENSRGEVNVPFGDGKPIEVDVQNLTACSAALRAPRERWVDLAAGDFEEMALPARDDFVYFDPPFVPVSKTASFAGYTAGGFGEADQRRLAARALELKERGVHVLLSNSDTPLVRELYPESRWRIEVVSAPRSVSCKGGGRGKVPELIIS